MHFYFSYGGVESVQAELGFRGRLHTVLIPFLGSIDLRNYGESSELTSRE